MLRTITLLSLVALGNGAATAAPTTLSNQVVIAVATGWDAEGYFFGTQGPVVVNCGNANGFGIDPSHRDQKW